MHVSPGGNANFGAFPLYIHRVFFCTVRFLRFLRARLCAFIRVQGLVWLSYKMFGLAHCSTVSGRGCLVLVMELSTLFLRLQDVRACTVSGLGFSGYKSFRPPRFWGLPCFGVLHQG